MQYVYMYWCEIENVIGAECIRIKINYYRKRHKKSLFNICFDNMKLRMSGERLYEMKFEEMSFWYWKKNVKVLV